MKGKEGEGNGNGGNGKVVDILQCTRCSGGAVSVLLLSLLDISGWLSMDLPWRGNVAGRIPGL